LNSRGQESEMKLTARVVSYPFIRV